MRLIDKICCVNRAAFPINFAIRWQDGQGEWHITDWNSGDYPNGQARTSPDLASIGVRSDALAVVPHVVAVPGEHANGNAIVSYSATGVTAKYNVQGDASGLGVILEE